MPRGKKTCPECNKETGPRTLKCECGHDFKSQKKSAKTDVKTDVSKTNSKNTKVQQVVTSVPSIHGVIITPNGSCPFIPEGYNKQTSSFTEIVKDEVIIEWANNIVGWGTQHGERYGLDALVYWARSFWDINSGEFNRIKDVLKNYFEPETVQQVI